MNKVFFIILSLLLTLWAEKRPSLTINSGFEKPETYLIQEVLAEVFKRAKIDLVYQNLPNKRSLINANRGLDDGDATRVLEISNYYPNLRPVPVEDHKIEIMALTNKKIKLTDPSQLSNYHVGVIRGMKIAVLMGQKAKPKSLTLGTDSIQLLKMLNSKRLDVVLINKSGLLAGLTKIVPENLFLVKKPLLTRKLYLHLHKKNESHIPALQKALQSMHDDGTYTKIQKEFYKTFDKKIKAWVTLITADE